MGRLGIRFGKAFRARRRLCARQSLRFLRGFFSVPSSGFDQEDQSGTIDKHAKDNRLGCTEKSRQANAALRRDFMYLFPVPSAPALRRNKGQFRGFRHFPSEPFPSPRGLALRLLQAGLLARLLPPPTPSHALFLAQWLFVGFVWLTAAGAAPACPPVSFNPLGVSFKPFKYRGILQWTRRLIWAPVSRFTFSLSRERGT